jgi:hypothetical protein
MSTRTVKVKLKTPIKVDGKKSIEEIEIREPKAGEMRGISVLEVLRMEVTAYKQLLPRISKPILTAEQIDSLNFGDIAKIMREVSDFLEDEA